MGNMCCRRVGYSPNGADLDQNRCHQQQQQHQQEQSKPQAAMSNVYHNSGDDCAINELLEGRMDLDVILPDGRQVRLTVERRTPMMDLLVQAASATKISPGGHVIHVFGDGGKGNNTLHYKPSTPIGSLDTNTICIVPKKDIQESALKKFQRIANRPFEPTFRVQVHLPRNQLTVVRISPRVKISELRNMVCQEKGLETSRYQMVRPSDPAQALSGDMTLAEYGSTEITLLSNTSIESNICNSTSHIIPYSKRNEEQKKKTGILRLLAEDANKKVERNNAVLNDHHRFVPARKTDDKNAQPNRYKPKKRRPAPPPPPPVLPDLPPFHSRQSSSDSSGYHEATSSFLHEEHCISTDEKASSDSSGVSSLDAKVNTVEPTAMVNVKKRKAPPPPTANSTIENSQVSKNDVSEPVVSGEVRPPDPIIVNEETKNAQSTKTIKKYDEEIEESQAILTEESPLPQNYSHFKVTCKNQQKLHEDPIPKVEPKCNVKIEEYKCRSLSKEPALTDSFPNANTKSKEKQNQKLEKKPEKVKSEPVTRVALVALNARIEQDVTQQEIASSIQAAFHSLERSPQRVGPCLLAIKQRVPQPEKAQVVQHSNFSEILEDTDLPKASTSINDSYANPYPLQKSTATLSLNLDNKDDAEIEIESFPPPPTEFRSDVKEEALVIDNESAQFTTVPRAIGSKGLKRSSSLLSIADVTPRNATLKSKNRTLQRSLSDVSVDDNGEFEAEQERLQLEYIKLQRQFIQWQQQLLNNHAMLSEECILPQYARTLRQSHSLPEGEDYCDETPSSIPMVSRSLSYEPTKSRCSTLPRSTINIPSLELNSKPITNGNSTLRSSKNKNYFKPPQVRVSTKSRQRLPPEIRKDGELDITDDSKILSTILPTFDTLKLITEHRDEEITSKKHLTNGASVKLENDYNRKTQTENVAHCNNPNKLATFPKPQLKINSGRPTENGHNEAKLKYVNENNGNLHTLSTPTKPSEQSMCSQPPPAPPLPIQNGKQTIIIANKSNKLPQKIIKKDISSTLDPREELMQEIRKFGGRTALRKISLE